MRKSLVVILLTLCTLTASAQFYNGSQLKFGKNRVQYRDFIWTFYMFDDYDVYFYRDGQKLAAYAARYAEKQIRQLERKLESNLNDKIQFIIFNSLTDLKQSNIGLIEDDQYNTGGITKIVGKKVVIHFNGSYDDFEKSIRAGISNVLINQLLYGGSIGSQIKNSTLFILPDWYLNGLISYLSKNWNTEIDNRVKDGVQSGLYEKFNHLMGENAVYAGHSLWRYIAQTYGKSAIPNILHMTNISHSIENGFLYVIGASFKTLMQEWIEYYKELYSENNNKNLPDNSLLTKINDEARYSQLTVSPDGYYAAFVTNELGRYKIWLYDMNRQKKKKIYKAGFKLGENIDYSYPILQWHPSGQLLTFIIEKEGFPYLMLYNLDSKHTEERLLVNFEKVLDYAYSNNGRKLSMSAVRKGQSDIYIFDIAAGSHEQLTWDVYDDRNPKFIDNDTRIVFSSNRPSDTLTVTDDFPEEIPEYYDLFLYNYQTKSNILKRLTETKFASEKQPLLYEKGVISFLSDENGIYNQYVGRFDSVISRIDTTVHYRYFMEYFPVTNYTRNIIEHNATRKAGKITRIIYYDELYRMFVDEQLPFSVLKPVELQNTTYVEELQRLEKEKQKITDKQKDTKKEKERRKPGKRFRNVYKDEDTRERRIDIDNYQFEKQSIVKINGDKVGKTEFDPDREKTVKEDEFKLPKRRNYRVEYSFNELTTQVDFDFLNATYQPFTGGGPIYLNPGFNALFKVGLTDLLEDHRIVGGVRLNVNLVNNEYLFNYSNLENRLDKHIIFHRQTIEGIGDYSIVRFHTNELFYILSWPFNEAMSLKGTFTLRNDATVFLSTDQYNLQEPNQYENWLGLKGEFTYDDTRNIGLNLYYGTRYKIFGEYYQLADKNTRNIFVLGADFRHYTKIHRSFIWANRIAASISFGKNKLIYYMGGVDNWLFPKFAEETPIDFSQNYWFQTLATNMRGFKQNIRNGNSFFVINSELRFPVFRYFFNRPIKSDFLNNFQVLAFGDVGTAWTGWSPYSEENSLYTKYIEDGPLNITVEYQKEPVVGGFGLGVRSRILGYFLRADWAWGVEDWMLNKAVFYLSLSLDF